MHALHNQSRRLLAIHSLCGAARIAFILSAGVWMLFYYCKFRPLVFGASVIIPFATIFMPIESENSITFVSVTARRYCVVVLDSKWTVRPFIERPTNFLLPDKQKSGGVVQLIIVLFYFLFSAVSYKYEKWILVLCPHGINERERMFFFLFFFYDHWSLFISHHR